MRGSVKRDEVGNCNNVKRQENKTQPGLNWKRENKTKQKLVPDSRDRVPQ